MTARTKATHKGECQACGSTQKLPGGVLSKHGYTVQWGFFEGVCPGSGYSPMEVSKDQVERYIADAEDLAAKAQARVDALKAPVPEGTTTGWYNFYQKATWNRGERHSGYVWTETEFKVESRELSSGNTIFDFYVWVPEHLRRRVDWKVDDNGFMPLQGRISYSIQTVEGAIEYFNGLRASKIERDARQIQSYIEWQNQRIENWEPKPLTPIKG